MFIRKDIYDVLHETYLAVSHFKSDSIEVIPAEHGFYLLTNDEFYKVCKVIEQEDNLLDKIGRLQYTDFLRTRCFVHMEDVYNEWQCIDDARLFEQVCRRNQITPVIVPCECFFAMDNPEIYADDPEYIFLNPDMTLGVK